MNGAERRFLPPGPWRLRRGYVAIRVAGALMMAGAALAILLGFPRLVAKDAAALVREAEVHAVSTNDVEATFERRGRTIGWRRVGPVWLRAIDGKASATIDERRVQVPIDLDLVVSTEADMPPMRIAYTNDVPRAFTTSWHAATRTERWCALAIQLLVLLAFFGAIAWVAWVLWRRARVAAVVAYDGVEIMAPYDVEAPRWWRRREIPRLVATWQLGGVKGTQRLDPTAKRGLPPNAGGRVLLLVSPRMPRHALVLDGGLRPLWFDDADVAAVHARIVWPDEPEEE